MNTDQTQMGMEQKGTKETKREASKGSGRNIRRLCAECLADVVKREQAKVIFYQENHKCDGCTHGRVGVFVAEIYCPLQELLEPKPL